MSESIQSSIDPIWLKNYPAGVPAAINADEYSSCVALIDACFAQFSQRPALACMGKTLTYGEFDELSRRVARWLQKQGFAKGTRVALMMPNILQYPIALFGVLRAGCVVVNVNPLYKPRELEQQLNDSGAQVIILLENFCTTLQAIIKHTKIQQVVVTGLGDLLDFFQNRSERASVEGGPNLTHAAGTGVYGVVHEDSDAFANVGPTSNHARAVGFERSLLSFPKNHMLNFLVRHIKKMLPRWDLKPVVDFQDLLALGVTDNIQPVEIYPQDSAFLQYTGGTTGVAKGAVLSHRNIVANVLQTEAWVQPGLHRKGRIEHPTITCALPLYHIYALTVCCLLSIKIGGLNVLIVNPRDMDALSKELRRYPSHIFPAVNTLYNALLNHGDFSSIDWSHLRIANAGGMAVQPSVATQWFEKTGCPILEGYGLSETSPCVSGNPTDSSEYSGTIGLPLPSTEVVIRDDANHNLPLGEVGEIFIRGPQVMAGYWMRPEETAKVIDADGFFRSGDLGFMDQRGQIKLVDRKKDLIVVSGFKVFPNEIEQVVALYPGVLEVAAVGVPDAHSGEVVKIFVVRENSPAGSQVDSERFAQELRAYCEQQLTGYKQPKIIEFCTALPKTNIGKISRRLLREPES